MVGRRCLRSTSLGITRSFPRLCPITGLVTVALLTLAPLALRPVRLACLIHAANVHSEPLSNPSKLGRASLPRPEARALARSSPEWLRKKTGRGERALRGRSPDHPTRSRSEIRPSRNLAPQTWGTVRAGRRSRRLPSRVQRRPLQRSTELSKRRASPPERRCRPERFEPL